MFAQFAVIRQGEIYAVNVDRSISISSVEELAINLDIQELKEIHASVELQMYVIDL
jgi:hypothetical protein